MPELPEVETTRRGLEPYVLGRRIEALDIRERRLRQVIPGTLENRLRGSHITSLRRRGKYLLLATDRGTVLIHLGMSGSLRVLAAPAPPGPHEHYDLVLEPDLRIRYRDPRRFGLLLWAGATAEVHPLIARIGPEPLGDDFDGTHLFRLSRTRRRSVKAFLMDSTVVAGVGNIYANEALFRAGIHPARAAGHIGAERYARLAQAVRNVLEEAIAQGGTTLRNFVTAAGRSGYFQLELRVYGRAGQPCPRCATPLRQSRIAQRASYFCPRCQH